MEGGREGERKVSRRGKGEREVSKRGKGGRGVGGGREGQQPTARTREFGPRELTQDNGRGSRERCIEDCTERIHKIREK